jgi:hypothetical protein
VAKVDPSPASIPTVSITVGREQIAASVTVTSAIS